MADHLDFYTVYNGEYAAPWFSAIYFCEDGTIDIKCVDDENPHYGDGESFESFQDFVDHCLEDPSLKTLRITGRHFAELDEAGDAPIVHKAEYTTTGENVLHVQFHDDRVIKVWDKDEENDDMSVFKFTNLAEFLQFCKGK